MKRITLFCLFIGLIAVLQAQDIVSHLETWYTFDYTEGDAVLKDYSGNARDIIPFKYGVAEDWQSMEFGREVIGGSEREYVYFPADRDADICFSNAADNHWTGVAGTAARTLCSWIRFDQDIPPYTGHYLYTYGDENQPGGCFKISLKSDCIEFENALNNQANDWCNMNRAWLHDFNMEEWHHMAVVYSGSGDRQEGMSLYLDGKKLDFPPNPGDNPDYSIHTAAQWAPQIGLWMKRMAIADFRVYSRALSEEDIRALAGIEYTIDDLRSMIREAIDRNESRLVIPPGVYRGPSPFISLDNVSDMEIIADGVTMICEEKRRAWEINNCKNVTLKGLTIDYDPLTFTQGDIIAVGSNYVDVKIHAGYPVQPYSRIDIIDPATRYRKRGMLFAWDSSAEIVDEGVVRVYESTLPRVAKVGDMASMSTGQEGLYAAPHALALQGCRGGMVLENVTIYCGPGFGIIEDGGEGGTVLRNCSITPGPVPAGATEERLLSTSWDAIQHRVTRWGPLVEGCVVRDAGDDSWSVTWDGNFELDWVEGDRITMKAMTNELQAGDTLRTSLYSEYVIISKRSGDLFILDRTCPWPAGTKIYSPNRRCEYFTLRNNNFRSSGRVLVKAGHGLIENNILDNGHSGVTVNAEANLTAISDLIIRNNTISGTGHFMPGSWTSQAGSVSFADPSGPASGSRIAQAGSFDRIVIENNTFTDVAGVNIVLTSATNVTVKENKFYETGITTPNNTGAEFDIDQDVVIYIKNCDNVILDDNPVYNRNLARLLVTQNVTGFTELNRGIYDVTVKDNLHIIHGNNKKSQLIYQDNNFIIQPEEVTSGPVVVSVFDLTGRLEKKR